MRRLVPALILAMLLSGCAVPTAESMYAIPGRPRGFARLEAAMDAAMPVQIVATSLEIYCIVS